MILIILGLLAVACCKEHTTPNQNILNGKLKTFEYDGILSEDVPVTFYFYYDSIYGMLNRVTQKQRINGIDTTSLIFSIFRNNNGEMLINNKIKIITNGKQITSIIRIDTINNTEIITTKTTLLNDQIDSFYDVGLFPLRYDSYYYNFEFINGNCYKSNTFWKEMFFASSVEKSAEYEINYTDKISNIPIYMQDITELFGFNSYYIYLYFLSLDGYYMVQPNKNLINKTTVTGDFGTAITEYSYEFTGTNVTKVQLKPYNTIDSNVVQYINLNMTYY